MSELHCDPGFRQLLAQHFSLDMLEQHSGTVYGLWPDLTLAYMNPAWFDFARDNGADAAFQQQWHRGRSVTDALPDVLHPFYVELYLRSLENQIESPLSHRYECSSPEQYRLFEMRLFNLGYGAGILVINYPQEVREHHRLPFSGLLDASSDQSGKQRQCSHCRCYQHMGQAGQWYWVPDWLTQPPTQVDHTLCPTCFEYYYSLPQ